MVKKRKQEPGSQVIDSLEQRRGLDTNEKRLAYAKRRRSKVSK